MHAGCTQAAYTERRAEGERSARLCACSLPACVRLRTQLAPSGPGSCSSTGMRGRTLRGWLRCSLRKPVQPAQARARAGAHRAAARARERAHRAAAAQGGDQGILVVPRVQQRVHGGAAALRRVRSPLPARARRRGRRRAGARAPRRRQGHPVAVYPHALCAPPEHRAHPAHQCSDARDRWPHGPQRRALSLAARRAT